MRISKLTARQLVAMNTGDTVDIEYKKDSFTITKQKNILMPYLVKCTNEALSYPAGNLADIKFFICDLV